MKKPTLILIAIFTTLSIYGQDITGQWNGLLKVQGIQLRVVFNIKYNPAPMLENIRCPVLAINGAKDLQVSAKINLEAIDKALKKGGNKKVTTKI